MPRLTGSVPRYCKHRASGQAIVTLSGQDFYLGPHGTKASKLEYDRQIAEWLARGRRAVNTGGDEGVTIVELIAAYHQHCKVYYRKHGVETREVYQVMLAAAFVRKLYGREPANDFGPLKLQAVQQVMIQADSAQKTINTAVGRIVRMFGWGVSQQIVRADVATALREVKGLHKGRSIARETGLVKPVADSAVHAVLDHLTPTVADMVQVQRFTGCRPEEVCQMRPRDIDTSGTVWAYRPASHKTEHHGRERVIFIGPKAQEILRPYLLRDAEAYCFCPADSERQRRDAAHAKRQTPITCGNSPGTNRRHKPQRPAGESYTSNSYRRAVTRACELAFGIPDSFVKRPADETPEAKAKRRKLAAEWRAKHCWAPNQLRHSAATEIRKRFGLEAAQVTLGHAAADVTQIYAERDQERAAEVMLQVG